MKYKYKLVENEEPTTPDGEETGGSSKENIEYELVLTPLAVSADEVVKALEDVNNYGAYTSNLRNTKSNVEKALVAHFGPSQRFDKLGLETSFLNSDKTLENFKDIVNKSKQKGKFPSILDDIFKTLSGNKGKFYPKSTATDINNFIRTLSSKPNLLKWNVVGDTLVFSAKSNPSEKVTKNIIKTVMDKAGIDYDLESKEVTNESKLRESIKEIIHKKLNVNESLLSSEIKQAIEKVDPNMSYVDFAVAVANVIKDDYGSHNIEPFMKALHKELGLNDESKLKKEITK